MARLEVITHNQEDSRIVPGKDWVQMFGYIRGEAQSWGRRDSIKELGIAVAGAAQILPDVEVDLAEFSDAAVPPMTAKELYEFTEGYRLGRIGLLGMPDEEIVSRYDPFAEKVVV